MMNLKSLRGSPTTNNSAKIEDEFVWSSIGVLADTGISRLSNLSGNLQISEPTVHSILDQGFADENNARGTVQVGDDVKLEGFGTTLSTGLS